MNPLTTCNSCDSQTKHKGCNAGYCTDCCTLHPVIGWEFTSETGAIQTLAQGVTPDQIDDDTADLLRVASEFRPVHDVTTPTTMWDEGDCDNADAY